MKVLYRILAMPSMLQFRRHAVCGKQMEIGWTARCENRNRRQEVSIGDNCSIWGALICGTNAQISIGSYTTIRYRSTIISTQRVQIGSYCILSNHIWIFDNNSHPTDPDIRLKMCKSGFYGELWDINLADKKEVIVEDNVWIGQYATILKGVTIGEGAIVAMNSVVTKDVPAYAVVAGNPAQVVKMLR